MPAGLPARNLIETIELQIGLQGYDPGRDKRFSGSFQLKHNPRPAFSVCIIGDERRCAEARARGLPWRSVDHLRELNMDKKAVKGLFAKFDAFLAAESLVKQIPRLLGKAGRFPTVLAEADSMDETVEWLKCNAKFQIKKVVGLGMAVGHVGMTERQLLENISLAVNFLISLLMDGWENIKTLGIKSTMGPSLAIV